MIKGKILFRIKNKKKLDLIIDSLKLKIIIKGKYYSNKQSKKKKLDLIIYVLKRKILFRIKNQKK